MWEPQSIPGSCFDFHVDRFEGLMFETEKLLENVSQQRRQGATSDFGTNLVEFFAEAAATEPSEHKTAMLPEQAGLAREAQRKAGMQETFPHAVPDTRFVA